MRCAGGRVCRIRRWITANDGRACWSSAHDFTVEDRGAIAQHICQVCGDLGKATRQIVRVAAEQFGSAVDAGKGADAVPFASNAYPLGSVGRVAAVASIGVGGNGTAAVIDRVCLIGRALTMRCGPSCPPRLT
jgi:hypothetical protein